MARSILNVLDLSIKEIDELLAVAEDIERQPEKYQDACRHKILATLFFEPSTRTRLSFESAMLSLGGSVLGFSNANSSSATKGETVADTVTVVSGYADIIAMRHPKEGAAFVAGRHAFIPVINAGDGGHYHPTQTLADLLTIHKNKGGFENLTIGLCGDLKYGRTVHSLIGAMARYAGVKFVLISPEELRLPEFVRTAYIDKTGIPCKECRSLDEAMGKLDVLYMTRVQKERFASEAEYEKLKDVYVLDEEKMARAKKDMIVLHPLPRVNEIAVEVDRDPRAKYFEQTRCGRLMRMALILKLLDLHPGAGLSGFTGGAEAAQAENLHGKQAGKPDEEKAECSQNGHTYTENKDECCKNPHCITGAEQTLPHLFYKAEDGKTYCAYCDAKL